VGNNGMQGEVRDTQIEFGGAGGLRLRVREWPSDGPHDGPPIVLVHGLASNSRIWDDVAVYLADRFHVVAYDQRGHGLSDTPDHGYGFAQVADDLDGLIAHLGLVRPVLVGHSWGGNVVLEYAATRPDAVAGLVLVDGGFIEIAADPAMTWERTARELAPPDLTHLTFDRLIDRARTGDAGSYWGDAVEATFRTSFADGPGGTLRPRLTLDRHLQILRALWEHRPSELYGRLRCPTLVVPARRAPRNAREAERGAARELRVARAESSIDRVRVTWMDDTVHDIPLQRPRELAALIAELAATTGESVAGG